MICKACGTEIADKALICYRCGAATFEAVRRPATPRPMASGPIWWIAPMLIGAAALGAGPLGLDDLPAAASYGTGAAGFAAGGWQLWRRA